MRVNLAIILIVFLGFPADSKQIDAVIYNGVRFDRKDTNVILQECPGADLEKDYLIKCHFYWPDQKTVENLLKKSEHKTFNKWKKNNPQYRSFLNENFREDLQNASLLYIGQFNKHTNLIFNEYAEEIKDFLARGGVIFFDYFGGISPELNSFLELISVENPRSAYRKELFKAGYYVAVSNPSCKNIFSNSPWKIKSANAYGWWTQWSDKQIVPFQNPKYPGKSASIIIQENVQGRGKVIFNSISRIFQSSLQRGNKKFLECMLSYIIGKNIFDYKNKILEEKGGPGEPAI
jgi:hypothetical protein